MEGRMRKRAVLDHRSQPLNRRCVIVGQQVEPPKVIRDIARLSSQLAHLLELAARFVVAAQGQQADGELKMGLRIRPSVCRTWRQFARGRLHDRALPHWSPPPEWG